MAERDFYIQHTTISSLVAHSLCVCMCVCAWEREREREEMCVRLFVFVCVFLCKCERVCTCVRESDVFTCLRIAESRALVVFF